MKPLSLAEKEYRQGLLRTERRAIIPIKWCVLAVTVALWVMLVKRPPGGPVLVLFGAYTLLNLVETWVVAASRVGLAAVRPLALMSYLADVVYVTMLIYFDAATHYLGETSYSNFYILYFLLVVRGYALFTALREIVLVSALISLLFIMTLWLRQLPPRGLAFLTEPGLMMQLVLIWVVILVAWFILVALRQQQRDLMRVHERLLRADNLARVGQLAAGVAHEINNPLGIIIATAEYLKKTTPPEDPRREDIDQIHRETNRCKDIIRQLLTYANPKPSAATLVEPAALNDEVLNFVFPDGRGPAVEVERQYAAHVSPITADPNLLKQALLNLYLNAKQALPASDTGRIVSRIAPARDGGVILEIEDNGCGIPPEDMDRLFDPFFSRKPEGTGLGLAVTQQIVEAFGGSIAIEPVEPRGTIVRLQFPLPVR